MKLTKEQYIEENIKLSLKNSKTVLRSIGKNISDINELSHSIQESSSEADSLTYLIRIKEISIESVIEKCNMLKASLDRYTICYEDVQIPKCVKYVKIRSLQEPPPINPNVNNKRFREKISKNNMPPLLAPIIIEDDGVDYD